MSALSDELRAAPAESPADQVPSAAPRSWPLAIGAVVAFACIAALGLAADARFGRSSPSVVLRDEFSIDDPDSMPQDEITWVAERGSFLTRDGAAWVAESNTVGPRTMTVADIGATNAKISVTAGQMTNGWGVVFRYQGASDFWFLQAAPDYAVFSVYRVAQGVAERVAATSLVELRDGMTVDVALRGAVISVSVSGQEIFRREDDHTFGATRAGLLASADAVTDGSWAAFAVTRFEDLPAPATVVLRGPLAPPPLVADPGDDAIADPGDEPIADPGDDPIADPDPADVIDAKTPIGGGG